MGFKPRYYKSSYGQVHVDGVWDSQATDTCLQFTVYSLLSVPIALKLSICFLCGRSHLLGWVRPKIFKWVVMAFSVTFHINEIPTELGV